MYRPGLSALKEKVLLSPGRTLVTPAPPPGPFTACRSMLWPTAFVSGLTNVSSTVSPSMTRIIGPGTVPSNVQKEYVVPSANSETTSWTVSVTRTVVGSVRVMGGGTSAGSRTTFGTSISAAGGTVGTAGVGSAVGRTPQPERISANTNPVRNVPCFMRHLIGRVEAA